METQQPGRPRPGLGAAQPVRRRGGAVPDPGRGVLARREALAAACRAQRTDWAFWAAACDATAAGDRIGRHYDTLVAPFAQVMPALARRPAPAPGSAADHQAEPDADGAVHD